jgi:hypothetical protein
MATTFTLPGGERITTATKSRYALIVVGERGPWIEKRSSSTETLRVHVRRALSNGRLRGTSRFIGDTATREVSAL